MLVAADLQRPAAIEPNCRRWASAWACPVFTDRTQRPARLVQGRPQGGEPGLGRDVVVVDTAGRLQIDRELMGEFRRCRRGLQPHRER